MVSCDSLGGQAETASQYLTKGRPVYIEGRLRLDEYTDRDGNKRQSLEVNATDIHFIGSSRADELGGTAKEASASSGPKTHTSDLSDDDIPF